MSRDETPQFRQHADGRYLTKWGGRNRYFGRDREAAFQKYLASLAEWGAWRTAQQDRRAELAKPRTTLTIHDVAAKFLESRFREGGAARHYFYVRHLRRFLLAYSTLHAQDYRPIFLQRVKDAMIAHGFAPKTINHDLQAVKTMLQWAMDLEMIQHVNLRGIRKLPLGEIPDKTWSVAYVRQFVMDCPDEEVKAWLAVSYLCALRPTEAVRIMRGEGVWDQRGVLKIPNKMRNKSRLPRRVLFSAEAFHWLRLAWPSRGRWSTLSSWSAAVRRVREAGPHQLRHSAGLHLIQSGVDRSGADAILGHYPGTVSLTYMPMQWRHLRRLAARITLVG